MDVYHLSQTQDGQWKCWTDDVKNAYVYGADPNEAIAKVTTALSDYRNYIDHKYGRCDDKCYRCRRGDKDKGLWLT